MKKIATLIVIVLMALKSSAQVNLQTGNATFSIPMFNWQDDKSRLNSVVALSYNSSNGLKVNDVASNIGQGWNLLAGGVITRMQVGQPDDQMQNDGNGTINDVNKYPAGYLYNSISASNGCPRALGYYPIFGDQNHLYKQHNSVDADREQDYFAFQFNGRSGVFVLGKNNGDQGISIGDSKLKIWFQRNATVTTNQHIRTTIISFSIQDENGLIYTFSQYGTTKLLKMHPSLPGANNYPVVQPNYTDGGVYYNSGFDEVPLSYNPYVINSWHLTQIQDPLTLRTITLNYIIRNCTTVSDNISYTRSGGDYASGYLPSKSYVVIDHNISITQVPEVNSIQYPDGNIVSFNYSNTQRFDYNGEYPLQSIDISYNNRIASRYLLNTTYFILNSYGIPATVDQKIAARLCLKSITKIGVDAKENEPPIIFDYYTGSNATEDFVPPPSYYAKDIWGYYNGNSMNNIRNTSTPIPLLTTQLFDLSYQLAIFNFTQLSTLCFLSNNAPGGVVYSYNTINPGFAKNGLLKSITYPQGSKVQYEYEQNIYNSLTSSNSVNQSNVNSGKYIGGVHVSKVITTDGGYSNGDNTPITTIYNYVNADETTTSQWGYLDPNNLNLTNYSFAVDGAHKHFLGHCTYDYLYPGILSKDGQSNGSKLTSNQALGILLFVGMEALPNLMSFAIDAKHFVFDPYAIIYDIAVELLTYIVSSCDTGNQDGYSVTYSNTNQRGGLLPIEFSRVEVQQLNINSQNLGKTVYEYTDFNDYPLWWTAPPYNIAFFDINPYSMKQSAASWAYGLPKKTTIYDALGNILKETQNVYNWNNVQRNASSDQSCNCYVYCASSLRSDSWSNYSNTSNITYSTNNFTVYAPLHTEVDAQLYNIYTGRVELSDTYERIFKPTDQNQYSETITHYDYNPNNYQVNKITATQSNGDKSVKEIYYPVDYSVTGILQTLNANNLVNVPIASYSSVIKNGASSPVYLGASVTNLTVTGNGTIKPLSNFAGRSSQPVTGFQFDPANPFNYPNLKQTQLFTYDAAGNLTGATDEGNRSITNIYDYNDKYVIASIINADPNLDKPCYTSFETQNMGGWFLNSTANYNTSLSVTGTRSLILDGVAISAYSLNTSKIYKLSFWGTGSITVSSGSLVATTPTVNGFTYYEYTLPANTSTISISGNGSIDELRLFPNDSRIHTVTYDPLIGKTAECDENNRISYYEYDNLGRLRFLKDANRNIVKMYEYNQKQNGNIGTANIISYNIPYVKLFLVNGSSYYNSDINYGSSADLEVDFYEDKDCTIPFLNTNNININVSIGIQSYCGGQPNNISTTYQISSIGQKYILARGQLLSIGGYTDDPYSGQIYPCLINYDYSLASGTGYIVP